MSIQSGSGKDKTGMCEMYPLRNQIVNIIDFVIQRQTDVQIVSIADTAFTPHIRTDLLK